MNYLEELFTLHGKTAVVTGGAGTIGTVMSDALLQAGANVVVWSLSGASIDAFLSGTFPGYAIGSTVFRSIPATNAPWRMLLTNRPPDLMCRES